MALQHDAHGGGLDDFHTVNRVDLPFRKLAGIVR